VNGLAYESSEADVRYFFEECGDIERINLPKYQNSDRNIGYCHVRFSRRRYARRALKLSGKYLDKRYLRIEMAQDMRGGRRDRDRDRGDRGDRYDRRDRGDRRDRDRGGYGRERRNRDEEKGDSTTIFIKNLPYDTNEDEVGDFFEDCGEVKSVRLIYNSGRSHFKGFGYVDFNDTHASSKALKLNGTDFNGRPIYIDMDHKKPRKSFGRENRRRSYSRSNSRSKSRDRHRRSRSRSKDKMYRHTTRRDEKDNDGDYNKSNHYYDKKYGDKNSRSSSSRSSRSNSSRSRSRSRSKSKSKSNSPSRRSSKSNVGGESEKVGLELGADTTEAMEIEEKPAQEEQPPKEAEASPAKSKTE